MSRINIDQKTEKIINLLRTGQIEWNSQYQGEGYTIYISEYDNTASLEDNLSYAEVEIKHQLYHQPQE